MATRTKLALMRLLNGPNARLIFILIVIAMAALAGGAPHDSSGG